MKRKAIPSKDALVSDRVYSLVIATTTALINEYIDFTFKQWIRVHSYHHVNINATLQFPDATLDPTTNVTSPAVYDSAFYTTSFSGGGGMTIEPTTSFYNTTVPILFIPPIVAKVLRFRHSGAAASCTHFITYSFCQVK